MAWLILCGLVILVVEINALTGSAGATKKPLDSVQGAITSGLAGDAYDLVLGDGGGAPNKK